MKSEIGSGLKSKVGEVSAELRAVVTELEMRDFAACVRATVGATHHSEISSRVVPTIYTKFRMGEFELIDRLGLKLRQILHAEQKYDHFDVLRPNEEIAYRTKLATVVEKRGKGTQMAFLGFDTDFVRVADGVKLATARSTMVYREAEGA